MKNYTVKLKITSEKEVAIAATNYKEALEMGIALTCNTEKLKLTSDDIVCVEGSLECPKVYQENDCIDEEFQLRKGIFNDYLKDTLKEITEYANELFSEE